MGEVAVKVHAMLESAQKLERFSKMPMPIEAEQSVLIADQQTVKGKAHAKVKLVPSMAAKEKKLKARVKHAEHMVKKTNAVAKKVEGLVKKSGKTAGNAVNKVNKAKAAVKAKEAKLKQAKLQAHKIAMKAAIRQAKAKVTAKKLAADAKAKKKKAAHKAKKAAHSAAKKERSAVKSENKRDLHSADHAIKTAKKVMLKANHSMHNLQKTAVKQKKVLKQENKQAAAAANDAKLAKTNLSGEKAKRVQLVKAAATLKVAKAAEAAMAAKLKAQDKYYAHRLRSRVHVIEGKANAKVCLPDKVHHKAFPTGAPKKGNSSPFKQAANRVLDHKHNQLRDKVAKLSKKLVHLQHQASNKSALARLKEQVKNAEVKLDRLKDEQADRVELARFPAKIRHKLATVHATFWQIKMRRWKEEKLKQLEEAEKRAVAKVAVDERAIARSQAKLVKGNEELNNAAAYASDSGVHIGASDLEQMQPSWSARIRAKTAKSKRWKKLKPRQQLKTLKQGLTLMRRQDRDVRSAMVQQKMLIKETEAQIQVDKRANNY